MRRISAHLKVDQLSAFLASIYAGAVVVLILVALSAHRIQLTLSAGLLIGTLFFFLLLGELFPIQVGHETAAVSYTFSGTATVALIGVGPGWIAIGAQLCAALIDEVRYRRPWYKAAFNLAQYALAVAAGREVYCRLVHMGFNSLDAKFTPHDFVPALVAALAFFLVNAGLMSIVLTLSQPDPILSRCFSYIHDEIAMATPLLAAGPVVLLSLQFSWQVAPVCALPILAVRNAAKRAAERESAAMHDPLTGLPNRALLLFHTEEALADPEPRVTALIVVDLDHFKEINDSLGHSVGDDLLKEVATRLRRCLRPTDSAARLGGDEFAILGRYLTSAAEAVALGQRLLAAISEPYVVDGIPLHVEASVGVAVTPEHAQTVDQLLQLVDVALYQAKGTGRNRVCLYDPLSDSSSAERLALMAQLRSGMDKELVLFYQPQCSAGTGALVGIEALVRWEHPQLGLLSPDRFLPSAENTGLIIPLTVIVIRTALAQLAYWDTVDFHPSVSVNISARHLTSSDLPDLVISLLRGSGIAAERLTLEITEDSIMTDPGRAIVILQQLREAGVAISIDDFGTGYSSLAYLRDLCANEVKIDRSFVSGGTSAENDLAVVRAATQLSHSLGLSVVAEGVESADQVRLLADIGVDVLQGYHILPPVRAEELLGWARHPHLWAHVLRGDSEPNDSQVGQR